ncbi:hypothetical protein SAMN04487996_101235 [Dyadobacter soli]|uniref:Uncharacterized protein n=1 Tax=Dyadobacter soli TaxID=659014 RepID=A0A1G6VG29_9BACT|nr:hypothetical protein SAMN04487996_101235 [Dyadobacter soli]
MGSTSPVRAHSVEKIRSKQGNVAGPEEIMNQRTSVRLQCQQMGDM